MADEKSKSFQLQVSQFSKVLEKLNDRGKKATKETLQNIKAFKRIEDKPMYLERFLQYPSHFRKKLFFQTLQVNDVVLGKLFALSGNEWTVKLLNIVEGQKRWIEDLQITATLRINKSYDDDDEEELEIGDYVKALVTNVNELSENILITVEPSALIKAQYQLPHLGKVEDTDSIAHLLEDNFEEDNDSAFLEQMRESSIYNHPQSIDLLASYFNVDQKLNGFSKRDEVFHLNESVKDLREKQSFDWSMSMVGVGVKHFREKNLREAKKCLDQALTFYPKNVEGYVARGALKANQSDLRGAIDDFRKALEVNPKHRNGRKYLIETSLSLARSHEKEKKWKESTRCYHQILSLQPDHKEARERYNQIHQLMSSKIINGPTASSEQPSSEGQAANPKESDSKPIKSKTKDRIETLKKLLNESSNNNKRKGRRKHSPDSSSTSTSSSTSSDSDDDDDWVEKSSSTSSSKRKSRRLNNRSSRRSRSRSKTRRRDDEKRQQQRRRLSDESRRGPRATATNCDNIPSPTTSTQQQQPPLDKDAKELMRKLKDFSAEEIDIVKKMLRDNESSTASTSLNCEKPVADRSSFGNDRERSGDDSVSSYHEKVDTSSSGHRERRLSSSSLRDKEHSPSSKHYRH